MKEWKKAEIEELELKCTAFSPEISDYIDDEYTCTNPDCPGAKDGTHNHFSFS